MVVEDDFLVASQIEACLRQAGFEVVAVTDTAEEALQLASQLRPLLAVMDIRLASKRDGIDAAIDLFQTLGIRCVFATAHIDQYARTRAGPAKPLAWVPKPYAMPSLIGAVREAVRELL
jgi:two-component system, response regulator PdtaR